MTRIERSLIADVLSIHHHAYRLLHWLGDQAREDPEILSADAEAALADPRRCRSWLAERAAMLPAAHRCPGREAELAALLSSFFRTSFHVMRFEWDGRLVDTQLLAGPSPHVELARKRARHGGSSTVEAVHRLCRDEGLRLPQKVRAQVASNEALRADLNIWCYAVGLVNRSQGRGEGPSDWLYWRAIPLAERKNLSADLVWAARARLLAHLEALEATQCASEPRR